MMSIQPGLHAGIYVVADSPPKNWRNVPEQLRVCSPLGQHEPGPVLLYLATPRCMINNIVVRDTTTPRRRRAA